MRLLGRSTAWSGMRHLFGSEGRRLVGKAPANAFVLEPDGTSACEVDGLHGVEYERPPDDILELLQIERLVSGPRGEEDLHIGSFGAFVRVGIEPDVGPGHQGLGA